MNRIVLVFTLAYVISPMAAEKVRVDFDHNCDFSRYHTYRWVASPDMTFLNQLMQERVIGFVEEALAAKRLRRVETGGDLLVNIQMNVQPQSVFTTFSDGFGYGWGGGITTTTEEVILQGALTVDLIDSHRGRLVFQATSTGSVSSKPEHNTKKLAKSVREIFEKYPPR